jgi:hypothetical protein
VQDKISVKLNDHEKKKIQRVMDNWKILPEEAIKKMIDFYMVSSFKYNIKYRSLKKG